MIAVSVRLAFQETGV